MIDDFVVELHRMLEGLNVEHAFGGALALDYYAEPRGTADVDINIEVPFNQLAALVDAFRSKGFAPTTPQEQWMPASGVRLVRDRFDVVDLFCAYDDYHHEVLRNAELRPFASSSARIEIPILSAKDLVVFKAAFNRSKDWVDVEAMLAAGTVIDAEYVSDRLVRLRGSTVYPRVARVTKLVNEYATLAQTARADATFDYEDGVTGHVSLVRGGGARTSPASEGLTLSGLDQAWVTSNRGTVSHRVRDINPATVQTRCGESLVRYNATLSAAPRLSQCRRCAPD